MSEQLGFKRRGERIRAPEALKVAERSEKLVRTLRCIGTTASGAPRHPLRAPKIERLLPWP